MIGNFVKERGRQNKSENGEDQREGYWKEEKNFFFLRIYLKDCIRNALIIRLLSYYRINRTRERERDRERESEKGMKQN